LAFAAEDMDVHESVMTSARPWKYSAAVRLACEYANIVVLCSSNAWWQCVTCDLVTGIPVAGAHPVVPLHGYVGASMGKPSGTCVDL